MLPTLVFCFSILSAILGDEHADPTERFGGLVSLLFGNAAMANDGSNADFDPVAYRMPSPPVLEGPLAPNTLLQSAQLLVRGNVTGPESLLVEGNTIYTGTLDARLLRIVDGQIVQTMRLRQLASNQTCGTYDTEPVCGRPLGIRRLDAQQLLVADAYLGVFKVNFEHASVKQVFSTEQHLNGAKPRFINDLDVLNETTVFVSDTSTRWDRRRFIHDFLEGRPTGRLIKLELESGESKVVLAGLNFANGVQIHPDNVSVLVNECSRARIVRYYFEGPKEGQKELFAENLPGFPDNIRLSHSGQTFLVGMSAVRHSQLLVFVDKLAQFPILRWAVTRFFADYNLATLFFANLIKPYGMVVELALNGTIVGSYQDPSGTVISTTSHAVDDEKFIYLGSLAATFIAKVPKN